MAAQSNPEGLSARLAAARRLQDVLKGAQFSPISSDEIEDSRDRAFANRLVTLALRRMGHTNSVLDALLTRGLPKKSGVFEAALRLGLAELLFSEDAADHSALFLAVELVKRDKKSQHLAKLMNGVLRQAQRDADKYKSLPKQDLFPGWMANRWRKNYGAEKLDAFANALLAGAPLDVTVKDTSDAAVLGAERVAGDSYRVLERDKPVYELAGFEAGRFWVQDAASAIPARLFGLPKGARVLDLCAAPGGKTAQLAHAGYQVIAVDDDAQRMARVGENLQRLDLSAEMVVADGARYEAAEKLDGVLVDAPCTATGTFRRHPELVWHRREADIAGRVKLQRKLLTQAVAQLKPKGVLIYAVCSLEPEEGEAQADWIAANLADMHRLPLQADELGCFASALDAKGQLRLDPGFAALADKGAVDGFFVSRFTFNPDSK